MAGPQRVLFVCTGNICRSPTADGVLRAMVAAAGVDHAIEVDSAGMIAFHEGHPADRRSIAAAARRGYDLSALRARQIRQRDYATFDRILAMDQSHLDDMRRAAPSAHHGRLAMFRDFCAESGPGDVPDPYYGGATGFEDVLDLIEEGCTALLADLLGR